MKFKELQEQLKPFNLKADYLRFTNYENYFCVYCNADYPTNDGVDMSERYKIDIADISPIRQGKFTIQHRTPNAIVKLIKQFADTDISER